ncbi:excinuclease ABC subunit A [Marivita sp.]|uniref:excinuclease ABC subunit A n=1 Tax=Marivita sp. TaxID=2003365 RepID=UPI003B51E83F
MRRLLVLIAAAAASLGVAAEAGNHKAGKGESSGAYKATDCPPGLAKKDPPCLPPGQARKYGRGDVIHGDYRIIGDPARYGLDRDQTYFRVGDYVYRVDREMREVLDLIGAVARVLD